MTVAPLVLNRHFKAPPERVFAAFTEKGLMQGWPDRIFIEGRSARPDAWEPLDTWYAQYEHPFVRGIGDGTLDPERFRFYEMLYESRFRRLVEQFRHKLPSN